MLPQDYDKFILLAIEKISPKEKGSFSGVKKEISKICRLPLPTNADLRETYERMVSEKKISRNPLLEKNLFGKKVRSQSGVAVVAVLTKPYPCPGNCFYCPDQKGMPRSYLKNEPAVMRAIASEFDPYKQTQSRLRSLFLNGHPTDKIELIVMGGTFSHLPKNYQKKFIAECFRACNQFNPEKWKKADILKKKSYPKNKSGLKEELTRQQKINESSRCRIIGLTLETRPDHLDEKEISNFRKLGCTRVELGVQSVFDDILKKNERGHGVHETIEAVRLLKDAGFKINFHLMPGLPGSSPKKDLEMFQKIFSDQSFRPDMIKIYPTVVVKGSRLYEAWKKGKYLPLDDATFEKMAVRLKNEIIPPYVRISRLIRDVPATEIEAGPKISNLRQRIAEKTSCRCIRCREVKGNFLPGEKTSLQRTDYLSSGGKEIFLEYCSPDQKKLFALLRLRISDNRKHFIPALRGSALIREVHTYGRLAPIKKKNKTSPQHQGLGKKLIEKAEEIARSEFGKNKIAVISGVGVRNYYRRLGYKLKETYMVKGIKGETGNNKLNPKERKKLCKR